MQTQTSMFSKIVPFFLAALLCANAPAQEKPDSSNKANAAISTPELADYLIGPEDILSINVWKEPEISRQVPVRPDGRISLPLIGDVEAIRLTPTQLQARITKALQAFISNPVVTVIVQEVKSQKFNIMGEVSRPGSYQLVKPMTVLDALAFAGGFKDFANPGKIYVLRVLPDGTRKRIKFDYKRVVKGQNTDQNIELEPKDTVVVP